jgi:hypothetical protein
VLPPPPPPPPLPTSRTVAARRSHGLVVLVAILLMLAVLTAGLFVTRPWAPSAAASSQTVWQAITGKIRDGQPSKDVALQAFAYLYKVAIPGVQVPPGVDEGAPTEGTMVTSWIQANLDQLTADQQAVVKRYLEPGPNDTVVMYDRATGERTSVGTGGQQVAAFRNPFLATVVMPRLGPARQSNAPSDELQTAFHDEVMADIAHIGPRLGLPTISEGLLLWKNITITFSEQDGGNTLYTTYASVNGAGIYSPCNITVWHQSWANLTATGGKLPDATHVLLTHEVVHCYQNVVFGSYQTAIAIPPWITEGSALWLAADDTKILETMVGSQWRDGWFAVPGKALTNRTYDGYSYFALLDHLGRSMWGQSSQRLEGGGHVIGQPLGSLHRRVQRRRGRCSPRVGKHLP